MSNTTAIIVIVAFLLAINFGTHYMRTWAFNRYEAVTFECSAIALLLSVLLIYRYGFRKELLLLSVLLLVMFVGNAMSQWHFYMTLQRIIDKAFDKRMSYMENHDLKFIFTNRALLLMASVAIMPSFSRFIEESKLFNNPGNLLGLIKSILKRDRFQKQKYRMRECFAENINLIGPCKPEITSMKIASKDEEQGNPGGEKSIPGAIRPNDLALNYTQEKWGLFAFDTLGFGALIIIFAVITYLYFHKLENAIAPSAMLGAIKVAGLVVVLVLFIALGHLLRLFAFARRESIHYEISFVALVVTAYRVFDAWLYEEKLSVWHYVILALAILTFGIHSFINRKLDKAFHKEVNQRYEAIMKKIPIDTETGRAQRKFLENLEVINEWAISPFLVKKKRNKHDDDKASEGKASMKDAEAGIRDGLNQVEKKVVMKLANDDDGIIEIDDEDSSFIRKNDNKLKSFLILLKYKKGMPDLIAKLNEKIAPEFPEDTDKLKDLLKNNGAAKKLRPFNIVSVIVFAFVFLMIGFGII